MSTPLSMLTSSQVPCMAFGSCVPRNTNTMPLSANDSTRHTLDDTMFMREMDGPMVRGDMTFTRPAATTAMMPLVPSWLATRYTMNGVKTSNSTWNVVFSSPHERTRRTRKLPRYPSARPMAMPPKKLTTKSSEAFSSENVPVVAAASSNWNATMPEASLMSDSPSRMLLSRGAMSVSFDSDATATASVGPSAAPSAKAANRPMEGSSHSTANPMMRAVTTTRPMASDSTGRRFFHSAPLSTFLASSNRSGAMNSTRNRSGSSVMLICEGANRAMSRPNPIWMRGEETLGTSWSITEESRTAASMSSASTSASTDRPPYVALLSGMPGRGAGPFIVTDRRAGAPVKGEGFSCGYAGPATPWEPIPAADSSCMSATLALMCSV